MPMDALCLSAVLAETERNILGGRIDKIHQPSRDEILLHIRGKNGPCRLLLSANPSRARIQLTALPRENPAEPPMFCMLLRKYLSGGKILELRQPPAERLAELVIEATNEMGDKVRRRLILEMMGRRTNLLLLDGEDRIVDCLRRVEGDLTQARPLLPGMFYHLPAPQPGKKDPNRLTEEDRAALLDAFYQARETADQVKQKGQDFLKSLNQARERLVRKMALQEKELADTANREQDRIRGDLITANLYRMKKGETVLRAENYYDPDCAPLDIPLDPRKSPQQNAAQYYKRYTKAKTAQEMLTLQLEKGKGELEYLDSVLDSVSRAQGDRDLEEIRQELVETGYLRRRGKAKDRMKRPATKPMEFRSTSGLRISVGRNNLQNDRLTTKQAGKWDYWFHTQKLHGAHVILWTDGQKPDEQSLHEAACLAAWFSQGSQGKKIPVDYTPVKFVKKPAGARPGMVVYTTYQTAYVDPDPKLAEKLKP